jgi:hypothetical protein
VEWPEGALTLRACTRLSSYLFVSLIRLPGDSASSYIRGGGSDVMSTLASIPWFLIGIIGIAWESVSSTFESLTLNYRTRRGYRNVPVDEDAQILRFEDE